MSKLDNKQLIPSDIIVVLGSHNVYQLFEIGKVTMAVETIHIHEDFNIDSNKMDVDVAVIVLNNDAHLNTFVNTVCLIDSEKEPLDVKNGTIISYGHNKTMVNNPEMSPKKIDTTIFEHKNCLEKSDGFPKTLSNRTICASQNKASAVGNEDQGSGLFVKFENRYYLRGIVTATIGDDQNGYSIFTDVAKFSKWIDDLPHEALEPEKDIFE